MTKHTTGVTLGKVYRDLPKKSAWPAIENFVHLTLISYVVSVIILAATLGYLKYQNDLNKPWATLPGTEVRSEQEFQQAEKFHGSDAQFCEWDSVAGSWTFTRNGKKVRTFKYLEDGR